MSNQGVILHLSKDLYVIFVVGKNRFRQAQSDKSWSIVFWSDGISEKILFLMSHQGVILHLSKNLNVILAVGKYRLRQAQSDKSCTMVFWLESISVKNILSQFKMSSWACRRIFLELIN